MDEGGKARGDIKFIYLINYQFSTISVQKGKKNSILKIEKESMEIQCNTATVQKEI